MAQVRGAFIDANICKGCGLCVTACPKKIIEIDTSTINAKGYAPAHVVDQDGCIACGACYGMCPDCAITVER
ncbi:MAG: 4Fe-4S dicluster domain-containing protein [Clostridiales bacterium]|nr:4Fe-4S dicluster domain-containing protein [Clostridiales bacterium]